MCKVSWVVERMQHQRTNPEVPQSIRVLKASTAIAVAKAKEEIADEFLAMARRKLEDARHASALAKSALGTR